MSGLSILFIANLTDLIMDLPISLCWPVIGTRRPILIFSSADTFWIFKTETKHKKIIILINIFILMLLL